MSAALSIIKPKRAHVKERELEPAHREFTLPIHRCAAAFGKPFGEITYRFLSISVWGAMGVTNLIVCP